jgi:hypothetical protein
VSDIALANSKRYESPGVDQIPARVTLHSELNDLIDSVWNKGELPEQWKEYSAPIYKNRK